MSSEAPVTVKPLASYEEMVAVGALHRRIFRRPDPYSPRTLLDIVGAGGQVLGGFVGKEMVGFAVALFALEHAGPCLFGRVTGVLRGHRDMGLGRLFKIAQRDHGLSLGVTRMDWVFSPLVARTAHFHLTSIGATSRAYEANYHRSTEGRVGPFAANDRLLARWQLTSPRVEARLAGERPPPPEGSWVTRVEIEEGLPRLAEIIHDRKEPRLMIEIPCDLYAFSSCPEVLVPWRQGVGQLLEKYVNADGYVVTECFGPIIDGLRRPFYLLEGPA